MKEGTFSKEAMEYLQSRYPHIKKSMFNGLLNMYGLISTNIKADSHIIEKIFSLEIPEEISDVLDIANKITFPETMEILYYMPLNDIDVVDALLYAYKHMAKNENQPLLVIELQDENSVPKVFYKGKEITGKRNVFFDWDTAKDEVGGLSYSLEHIEENGITKIERRVKGHAFD